MDELKLIKINQAKQYCISLYELKKLGYGYPEKGTMVYVPWKFDFFRIVKDFIWEKFYEPNESGDGVYVSLFGTYVGKRLVSDSECYITIEEMSKIINNKIK